MTQQVQDVLRELIAAVRAEATAAERERAAKDELTLRRLLWLALDRKGEGYGDDGEMQLFGLDFKRMPVQELKEALYRITHQRVAEWMASEDGKRMMERIRAGEGA